MLATAGDYVEWVGSSRAERASASAPWKDADWVAALRPFLSREVFSRLPSLTEYQGLVEAAAADTDAMQITGDIRKSVNEHLDREPKAYVTPQEVDTAYHSLN